jgi:hypothetical protein
MMQRPGADCGQKQDPGGGMRCLKKKSHRRQKGRKKAQEVKKKG